MMGMERGFLKQKQNGGNKFMDHLEYLEMHLMNSCNLKCQGCSHFLT